MRLQAAAPVLALLLSCQSVAVAQSNTTGTAADKLRIALDNNSLQSPGIRPWHWKMDVTLYDADGKNPKPGSIEAWYAEGKMRSVLTLDGVQLTTLRLGDQLYRSEGDAEKFVPLEIVFMQALNPIPDGFLDPSVKLKLSSSKSAKIALDCVQPSFTLPQADTFSTDSPLSYCFLAGTDHFVVSYQASQTAIARVRVGNFQSKQVPIAIQISSLGHKRVELTTTTLETFTPGADDFALQPVLHSLDTPVEFRPSDVFFGLLLVGDAPHYPVTAKSRHAEGAAKFDVVIGTDGKIISKSLSNKVDPDLAEAARQALTHWIYRPYLVNGIPVKVKTTITINFTMG
jgi:TonB family protein